LERVDALDRAQPVGGGEEVALLDRARRVAQGEDNGVPDPLSVQGRHEQASLPVSVSAAPGVPSLLPTASLASNLSRACDASVPSAYIRARGRDDERPAYTVFCCRKFSRSPTTSPPSWRASGTACSERCANAFTARSASAATS